MHVPNVRRGTTTRNCESPKPANNLTHRLNLLLMSSGPGYILSLCPGQQYVITAPLLFASPNQEISTAGYPTGSSRATLVVGGPVVNGMGHTTAVDGACANCNGVKLRNIQIDGARRGAPPTAGGANIEMGGSNANQLIEHVHSFDPKGWSCLHVAEGDLSCTHATVQNNDIGPAGSDAFQEWADGISIACRDSVIRNNMIKNPTDGGIVLFGSPGTRVENNTIWVETHTLLGGINMVDVSPFGGDYKGVVVTKNTITGGFASQPAAGSKTKGTNNGAIIKIGIAIGPRVWFGDQKGNDVSTGGAVYDNKLTGAFSYGIAINSATNFIVENNALVGNTAFIGVRGPNCTANQAIPAPAAFVIGSNDVQGSKTQGQFTHSSDCSNLPCVQPPPHDEASLPVGKHPNFRVRSMNFLDGAPMRMGLSHLSVGATAGIVFRASGALLLVALVSWFAWKRALKHSQATKGYSGQF